MTAEETTPEATIEERFEKMRRVRADFDSRWRQVTAEHPPEKICPVHGIGRSVDVERSLNDSWRAQDYRVAFWRCKQCVAEERKSGQ